MTSYVAGPSSTLRVWTYKNPSTVLARFAHDLCLEVKRFSLQAVEDSQGQLEVRLRVDTQELRLMGSVTGSEQIAPMKARDQLEIERTARNTVLKAKRNPHIVFNGTGTLESLRGTLELNGTSRALTLRGTRTSERCSGSIELAPSQWGIPPYRAFLGALKLADRVTISWDLELVALTTP